MEITVLTDLAISLGIGLIIGLERGWTQRNLPEGTRVAGIRTFTLIGFLGGIAAYLGKTLGLPILMAIAVAVLGLIVVSLVTERRRGEDRGITTEVSLIITFGLGLMSGYGAREPAVAGAVVVAVLLGLKPSLHHWLETLHRRELLAAFKFLVITLVILPVLPNRGLGPWDALNPYVIWLMVVLASGISLGGFIATRLVGPERGLMATGLLGGLSSSTAVSVSMARLSRESAGVAPSTAAAAIAASTVLYPRAVVLAVAFSPALAEKLAVPLGVTTVASCIALALLWPTRRAEKVHHNIVDNLSPFDLSVPLRFGAVLAVLMLATAAIRAWIGDSGLIIASAIAGLTDADAPTLASAHAVNVGMETKFGALAVMTAIGVNTLSKLGIVAWLGDRNMTRRCAIATAITLIAGGIGTAYMFYRQ